MFVSAKGVAMCSLFSRLVLVGVLFITIAAHGYIESQAGVIADSFRDIELSYRSRLADLREVNKATLPAIVERDERLRNLVGGPEPKDLDYYDLLAYARAHEYLRNIDKTIVYARRAISCDSAGSEPYLPLVRALLSRGDLQVALKATSDCFDRFPNDTAMVSGLNFMLSAQFGAKKQWRASFDHARNALLADLELADRDEAFIGQFVGHLRILGNFSRMHEVAASTHELVDHLEFKLRMSMERRRDAFHHCVALHRAHLRLIEEFDAKRVASAQGMLVQFASSSALGDSFDDERLRVVNRLLATLPERSYAWLETNDLRGAVDASVKRALLIRDRMPGAKSIQEHVIACKIVLGLIDQHSRLTQLVGKPLLLPTDVRWMNRGNRVGLPDSPAILILWNPLASGCRDVILHANEWNRLASSSMFRWRRLEIYLVSPYCGLDWDSQEKRLGVAKRSQASEEASFQQMLADVNCQTAAGLIDSSSPFLAQFGGEYYPIVVLVNRDGKVQEVCVGGEAMKWRHLHGRVSRLMAGEP